MTNRHVVNRALPERSNLRFYFPAATEGNSYYTVTLPFFENIKIRERKRARYKKYSLISRSSNLYSYLGADSRMFDLDFNISLPHLLEEHPEVNMDKYIGKFIDTKVNPLSERNRFKYPYKAKTVPNGMAFRLGNEYTKRFAKDSAKQVITNLTTSGLAPVSPEIVEYLTTRYGFTQEQVQPLTSQQDPTIIDKALNFLDLFNPFTDSSPVEQAQLEYVRDRTIDLIVYWVNIIRASLTNNTDNPIYGPPIVRLKHGIMYQNIPCICTDYSIDFNEAFGYDINTLLPRQIKVSMKLEEFRTEDSQGSQTKEGRLTYRDSLAGWEAVILGETNSMDPGDPYV